MTCFSTNKKRVTGRWGFPESRTSVSGSSELVPIPASHFSPGTCCHSNSAGRTPAHPPPPTLPPSVFPFKGRARACGVGGSCGQPELRSEASADRPGGRFLNPLSELKSSYDKPTSLFDRAQREQVYNMAYGFCLWRPFGTFFTPHHAHTHTRVQASDKKQFIGETHGDVAVRP